MFLRGARSFDWRALAARAARDDALSLIVARMGENAASVSTLEGGGEGGDREGGDERSNVPVGLGPHQVKSIHVPAASGGGVREGIVRALLPLVLSTCGRGSPGAIKGKGVVGHTHWRWTTGLRGEVRMIVYLLQYCSTLLRQSHSSVRMLNPPDGGTWATRRVTLDSEHPLFYC